MHSEYVPRELAFMEISASDSGITTRMRVATARINQLVAQLPTPENCGGWHG